MQIPQQILTLFDSMLLNRVNHNIQLGVLTTEQGQILYNHAAPQAAGFLAAVFAANPTIHISCWNEHTLYSVVLEHLNRVKASLATPNLQTVVMPPNNPPGAQTQPQVVIPGGTTSSAPTGGYNPLFKSPPTHNTELPPTGAGIESVQTVDIRLPDTDPEVTAGGEQPQGSNEKTTTTREGTSMFLTPSGYHPSDTIEDEPLSVPAQFRSVITRAKSLLVGGKQPVTLATLDLPPTVSLANVASRALGTYRESGLPLADAFIFRVTTKHVTKVNAKPTELAAHFQVINKCLATTAALPLHERLEALDELLDGQVHNLTETSSTILAQMFSDWFGLGYAGVIQPTQTLDQVKLFTTSPAKHPSIAAQFTAQPKLRDQIEELGRQVAQRFMATVVYNPVKPLDIAHIIEFAPQFGFVPSPVCELLPCLIGQATNTKADTDSDPHTHAVELRKFLSKFDHVSFVASPVEIWVSNMAPAACLQEMGIPFNTPAMKKPRKNVPTPNNELECRLHTELQGPAHLHVSVEDHTVIKLRTLVNSKGTLVFTT